MNPTRNIAVDAYRGFVMLLMMAEVLQLSRLADAFPSSAIIGLLAYHQTHVDWAGCSLHDMIQPSFSFLVGVALPYSVARRQAEGRTLGQSVTQCLLKVGSGGRFHRVVTLMGVSVFCVPPAEMAPISMT